MDIKKIDSKIDDVTKKAQDVVTDAGAAARKGGRRIEETAEKAGDVVEEITVKVVHAVEETAQKVVDGAKQIASKVRHQGQEPRGPTGSKSTGPARSTKVH
jgi:vacuolar-type H+-ATPase subunit H